MTDMTEAEAWAQLQPLRRVILDEMVKPVQMTALGLDELVDRVTVAVAKYMAGVVPATAQECRELAGAMEKMNPPLESQYDHSCSYCGASVTETKNGRATLHRAGCKHPGERGPQ